MFGLHLRTLKKLIFEKLSAKYSKASILKARYCISTVIHMFQMIASQPYLEEVDKAGEGKVAVSEK